MKLACLYESNEVSNAAVSLVRNTIAGTEFEGKVYIAGGFVRDEILGKDPKDIDIVVDMVGGGIKLATFITQQIGNYKEGSNPVIYPKFGTAKAHFSGIVYAGVDLTGMDIECVAPRVEEYDPNSRKPMVSAGSLLQDVERRDFTINSLLKNVTTGEVVDLTGRGREDLEAGVIRTPLEADVIFSDDPLRMLRGIRFAVKYGWDFAPGLQDAITKNAARLAIISKERVRDELIKMLISPQPVKAIQLMMDTGLLEHVHPKLAESLRQSVGMEQNRHHMHDVYGHIMAVLENSPADLETRLAALLHDIGKPAARTPHERNEGEYAFHGHEDISAEMATEILQDLKFPSSTVKRVVAAISAHMVMKDPENISDRGIRRWVRKLVGDSENPDEVINTAINLLRADALGHRNEGDDDPGRSDYLRNRITQIDATAKQSMQQKVVSGHDLMGAFDIKPGPSFKPIMTFIQDLVDESPEITKVEVLELVRQKFFE